MYYIKKRMLKKVIKEKILKIFINFKDKQKPISVADTFLKLTREIYPSSHYFIYYCKIAPTYDIER